MPLIGVVRHLDPASHRRRNADSAAVRLDTQGVPPARREVIGDGQFLPVGAVGLAQDDLVRPRDDAGEVALLSVIADGRASDAEQQTRVAVALLDLHANLWR